MCAEELWYSPFGNVIMNNTKFSRYGSSFNTTMTILKYPKLSPCQSEQDVFCTSSAMFCHLFLRAMWVEW